MSNYIKYSIPMAVGELWFRMNWVSGFETRIVGGAVRDWVMGKEPKDLDFCTTATPEQMIAFAKEYDYRIEPTGMQHGTVSFIIDGVAYEFTTLRVDTDCDGRHASVEFTTDFEVDAARRDFTFNAMSLDIDGKVHDYFGGWEDAKAKHVCFVGAVEERVAEDYLRVLRFFRFAARYEAGMSPIALGHFKSEAVHEGLSKISRERIWAEVSKTVVAPGRDVAIAWMEHTGIAEAIGMVPNQFADKVVMRAVDAPSFMAGFCGDDPVSFAKDWKMSTAEARKMTFVFTQAKAVMTARDVIGMCLDGIQKDWIVAACAVHSPHLVNLPDATWPKFEVSGADLIAEGFVPGKEFGEEMDRRRAAWRKATLDKVTKWD